MFKDSIMLRHHPIITHYGIFLEYAMGMTDFYIYFMPKIPVK